MKWDTAGQEKFGGPRYGYYIQGKAAIVVFEHQSKRTLDNANRWHHDVLRICENIPVVLCGNKSDLGTKHVPTEVQQKQYLAYHSVSAKTNDGYEKPFLSLAKHFMGEDTVFVPQPKPITF